MAYLDYGGFYGECDPNPNPYSNPYVLTLTPKS